MTRRHARAFTLAIACLVFLDIAMLTAVVPLLAYWHDTSMGLSKGEAGLVVGAFSGATLLASIPMGRLADRVGAKRITLVSTLAFAVSVPLLAPASTAWELIGIRTLQGLCSAVSWTAGLAWLNEAVAPGERARAIAVVTAAGTAGALAGPAIGGPLADALGLGATTLLVAACILAVFAALLRGPRGVAGATEQLPWRGAIAAFRLEPRVKIALLAILNVAVVGGALQVLAPLHLSARGLDTGQIGWTFAAAAAFGAAVNLAMMAVADRLDRLRLVWMASAGMCAGVATLLLRPGVAPYVAVVIAVFILISIGYMLAYPLCADGADRAGLGHGVAMGALNTVWGVGQLASPVAAGLVAHHAGDAVAYAAVVVAGGGLVAVMVLGGRTSRTLDARAS